MTDWSDRLRKEIASSVLAYSKGADTVAYPSNATENHVLLFPPATDGSMHGNFVRESYAAIQSNAEWRSRLSKRHSRAKHFPPAYRETAGELDSCMSSDALLMNFFCYPDFLDDRVAQLFRVKAATIPEFGVKAKVNLKNGREDLTEIDMQLGSSNIEAKLTERDFTTKTSDIVEGYADFEATFDKRFLEVSPGSYLHYQLIRNVLAILPDDSKSFFLILDSRRPDLLRAWWSVHSSIRNASLRARCGFVFWQELAQLAPQRLRAFVGAKYGIGCCEETTHGLV